MNKAMTTDVASRHTTSVAGNHNLDLWFKPAEVQALAQVQTMQDPQSSTSTPDTSMPSVPSDTASPDLRRQRPWRKGEAITWWVCWLVSLTVMAWCWVEGWVHNPSITRVHDAGVVVAAQGSTQSGGSFVWGTVVSTDRLVVPLVGAATLALGEVMVLQQRASGRYYLCNAPRPGPQQYLEVRGQQISGALTHWQTPLTLGMAEKVQGGPVPGDWEIMLVMWLGMLGLLLGVAWWVRPFGPGRADQAEEGAL